jgi:ATP phosphoribosyltransferase regulatory subunit
MDAAGYGARLRVDFSLMNDIDYYSGIVFQGYVQGVSRAVLSGGYYGALMKKFGHDLDAIGFAVYLNELSHLYPPADGPDVDALVLYGEGDDPMALMAATERLRAAGLRVRVERDAPAGVRYKSVMRLLNGKLEEVDDLA